MIIFGRTTALVIAAIEQFFLGKAGRRREQARAALRFRISAHNGLLTRLKRESAIEPGQSNRDTAMMPVTRIRSHASRLLLALALGIGSSAVLAAQWNIRSLGTLGGSFSVGVDINSAGQVAGYSETEPRIHDELDPPFSRINSFLSAPGGGALTEPPMIGLFFSRATAVNQSGQLVGETTEGSSATFSFVTGPNASGTLAVRKNSVPADINNVGKTVTNDFLASNGALDPNAHLINNDGSGAILIQTPDLPPLTPATAVALNDRNQVAVNGTTFGYIWTGPGVTKNVTPGALSSRVFDINEAGQVIGVLTDALGERAFITGADGIGLTYIGAPGDNNLPAGLNILGQVVGMATFSGETHGYVSGPGGGPLIDLDALADIIAAGWSDLSPVAINDLGEIAGTGFLNGQQRAFFLTPVLEPGTYALLIIGLGCLCC